MLPANITNAILLRLIYAIQYFRILIMKIKVYPQVQLGILCKIYHISGDSFLDFEI